MQAIGKSDSNSQLTCYQVDVRGCLRHVDNGMPRKTRLQDLSRNALATILPAGYPEAVNAGYGSYTGWQFTSMVFSSAAGVLSTQALLHAVGLGSGAIPLAAALNWVIKDGLGQLGGVIFSSMVSTRFDANPKLWRMVSALALDASTALELLSPFFPGYFVALASVANVGKNVSFLAASASRAAIHNAFAKRENLADITGKAGSQVIISSMAGMGLGIALAAVVGSEWSYVAPTAAILCFGHLTSTYQCLRPVVLPTIDSQRLELILDAEVATGAIPQPAAVSAHETIFLHPLRAYLARHKLPSLVIGAQVSEAIRTSHELQALWDYASSNGDAYMIAVRSRSSSRSHRPSGDQQQRMSAVEAANNATAAVDKSGVNSSSAQRSACVYLLLLEGATSATVLQGARHAYAVRNALVEQGYTSFKNGDSASEGGELLLDVVKAARPGNGKAFVQELHKAGWHTDVLFFEHAQHARVNVLCK